MNFIKRNRLLIVGLGLVVLVGGFLAFRPDKLFVDDAVNESLADAFADVDSSPTDTTVVIQEEAVAIDDTDVTIPEVEVETPTAPEPPAKDDEGPVAVTTGGFYGIDHSAAGTATVYEQDGEYVLRFEDDTDIQNGPDLYVWVLPDGDYDGGDPTEYLDLGTLKGNIGGQNYELPDGYDPELHQTVLIWCLRFGVPFAAAPLG